jgi:hypothetical protein
MSTPFVGKSVFVCSVSVLLLSLACLTVCCLVLIGDLTAEKSIKEKYLDVVRKLPNEELKNFRKAKYRDIMIEEMKEELNGIVSEDIIKSSCHYMSNAPNNESIRQFGQRKRQKQLGKVKSPIRTRQQTVKPLVKSVHCCVMSIYFQCLYHQMMKNITK